MLSLTQFLEVPEGVIFKFEFNDIERFKIENNVLMFLNRLQGNKWEESFYSLNDIASFKIEIVGKCKEILTNKEKEYLKAVIEPYKDKDIVIAKACNAIMIYSKNEFIMWVCFECTKEMQFKGLKELEEYAMIDLDLEK